MKKSLFKKSLEAFAFCAAIGIGSAHAVTLSLSPASQTAGTGDTVTLDLVVAGLTSGGADSLGDFDVDIGYDTTHLSFSSYSLGTGLGDIGLGEAIDLSFGEFPPGVVNLAEVSLLLPSELDALQSNTFVLATIDFGVVNLAAGASTTVWIDTVYAVGDGFGLPLALTATSNAVIRNPDNGGNVPVPAPIALLGFGLVGIALRSRKSA